jgi:diguanylate cyclase (GGDEF)-like protein
VEAERARALGDFRAAAYAFDVAQREAADRRRPWHGALIKERAARLYLSHGMRAAGHALLGAARREYHAWGALGKVRQLDRAHPDLPGERQSESAPRRQPADDPDTNWPSTISAAIDLFGIVASSQALSSATSMEGLRTRVVQVLGEMTGATSVHLLVRNSEEETWLLATAEPGDATMINIDEAGSRGMVPMSVIRYAERTSEPLLISDAASDDRFMRDRYVANMDCCSMLVVPILSRGVRKALLILENRFIRAAFSTERIDAVMLVAGQLAVSLDNARVYASLERKVAERTAELAQANQRLETLSGTDALTGLANRRRLEAVLATEWDRAEAAHTPLSLAMVDIDHFKLYNDRHGHLAGDEYLRRTAAQLLRHSRRGDLVSRYGGEEFAIVMPNTGTGDARAVAERLRTAVSEPKGPASGATDPIATVSIGVATVVPTSALTPTDLISAADVQLYEAKRGGRNRVNTATAARPR